MILFSLCRWLFYVFNLNSFGYLSFGELISLMFAGIRFDLAALVMFNLLYILLLAIPAPIRYHPIWKKTADQIFIWTNALAIGLNLIDTIYFRFISKRTTTEIFQFLGNPDENILLLLWQFLYDYWYMWMIWVAFIWVLFKITRYFIPQSPVAVRTKIWYAMQTVFLMISVLFIIIAGRGGFQLKPISLVSAASYASTQQIPLVLNTPFSIAKTLNQNVLQYRNDFTDDEQETLYTPVQQTKLPDWFKGKTAKPNFVILILESFGQELIGFYNPQKQGLTPFLDSLLENSITFDGYANGRRSIEALPAILAGIPSLMPVDYPTSAYAANTVEGMGSLLRQHDYTTAFFHGGNNGTMNFDATARALGFDLYFGRNEYANEDDFDGSWGIFDGPFLKFSSNTMNDFTEPFISAIFTLSSHHPFSLPKKIRPEDQNLYSPFENTIRYADLSLRMFFETAKQTQWFANTVFIFTADHTHPEPQSEFYRNEYGMYKVPLAFYSPLFDSVFHSNETAQQTDIMPTVLSLVNYKESFLAFGNNLFAPDGTRWHISFINQMIQLQDGNYLLQFDGSKTTAFFDLETDSLLQHNLVEKNHPAIPQFETKLRAILQQYNNRMISNKLTTR
jgi:phosphoglycerol transferase MdoB-like AlkP superfamily enzyme